MSRIRGKDTAPEMAVRRFAHGLGYRFRLHRRDLPGRPDLVFPGLRKVIQVNGCFWHQHPDPGCRNAVMPKTRPEWWRAKLLGNVRRDQLNAAELAQLGWQLLTVWECQVRAGDYRHSVIEFLSQGSSNFRPPSGRPRGGTALLEQLQSGS
jgi:DNA mismatch endonuclease (patch repair protein)